MSERSHESLSCARPRVRDEQSTQVLLFPLHGALIVRMQSLKCSKQR